MEERDNKNKRTNGFTPIFIILIMTIIAAGGIGGYTYIKNKQPRTIEETDAHGCLVSSGYSWCNSKQKCIKISDELCEETTIVSSILITTTTTTTKFKSTTLTIPPTTTITKPNTTTSTSTTIKTESKQPYILFYLDGTFVEETDGIAYKEILSNANHKVVAYLKDAEYDKISCDIENSTTPTTIKGVIPKLGTIIEIPFWAPDSLFSVDILCTNKNTGEYTTGKLRINIPLTSATTTTSKPSVVIIVSENLTPKDKDEHQLVKFDVSVSEPLILEEITIKFNNLRSPLISGTGLYDGDSLVSDAGICNNEENQTFHLNWTVPENIKKTLTVKGNYVTSASPDGDSVNVVFVSYRGHTLSTGATIIGNVNVSASGLVFPVINP